MTQSDVAIRLGVTQKTLSALERNASKVNADRLLKLLSIVGVELVLRQKMQLQKHPITLTHQTGKSWEGAPMKT